MDYETEERGKKEKPRPREKEGPRAPRMPGTRVASRCAGCGRLLPALTEPLGQCSQCGFELHSCKQCTHFDPGSRYECTQPIPKRIAEKTARNDCSFFALRVIVEKDTSPDKRRPEDARQAFANLFKK